MDITGIKANLTQPQKVKTSEKPSSDSIDNFSKGEISKKLDADIMKEMNKTLNSGGISQISSDINTPDEEYPRHFTDEEKKLFKEIFPDLDVDKTVVTAPATMDYNCISWTVGETKQWFWPPKMYYWRHPDQSAFDLFYEKNGFVRAEKGEIAVWGKLDGYLLTHGCVSGPGHGPSWESKCGDLAQIQHELSELEGNIYGKPVSFYTRAGDAPAMQKFELMEITTEMKSRAKEKASQVKPEVKENFDNLYNEWQNFRKDPALQLSANPEDYCKTKSFDEITKMGSSVIPLLMEKMSDGDFFCLQAVEKIAKEGRGPERALKLSQDELVNSEQNKSYYMLNRYIS